MSARVKSSGFPTASGCSSPKAATCSSLQIANGAFDQLTRTREPEFDPKLSPDGQYVSFRRGPNLFSLDSQFEEAESADERRRRNSAERPARLGLPGRTGAQYRSLVVSGFAVRSHICSSISAVNPCSRRCRYLARVACSNPKGTPKPVIRMRKCGWELCLPTEGRLAG